MKKIAFITSQNAAGPGQDISSDDALAIEYLIARDIQVMPVVWNSSDIDWDSYDLMIIRSCWDYHLYLDGFVSLLDFFEREDYPVHNSPRLVRWNLHKKYLLELEQLGIPIVKTRMIEKQSGVALEGLFEYLLTDEIVVKPAVSLGGHNTFRVAHSICQQFEAHYNTLLHAQDILVQEFLPEIFSEGEYSFVFFDGCFSHAIVKRATTDFRIHREHGGVWQPFFPDDGLIAQAEHVLNALKVQPLYARVDAILRDGVLYLMELEVTDPRLYFSYKDEALSSFSKAINKLL